MANENNHVTRGCMTMAKAVTIGEDSLLCFHLNLYPMGDERDRLAWGDLIVTLEGEPVWCAESERGEDAPDAWDGKTEKEIETILQKISLKPKSKLGLLKK